MTRKAPSKFRLVLEDGTVYEGVGFGHPRAAAGEVVFNTGMVGYPESMTDPSYRGQILVMTYPLVGNYGVPAYREDEYGLPLGFESKGIQIAGLVVSEYSTSYSHHDAEQNLDGWLCDAGIPGIYGVDTRALTRRLREKGSMLGKIDLPFEETHFFDPMVTNLVASVSPSRVTRLSAPRNDGRAPGPTVVLLDCGCKASIARALLTRGLNVVRVPHDNHFLAIDYDGLLISNGPGNPEMCTVTIRYVKQALAMGKPIFGICLGHQILALAAGAEISKLKFGHRGQNQPCLDLSGDGNKGEDRSRRCVITAQNHGYVVRADRLPQDWEVWFVNANDGTVEGIRHRAKPFWGVQFHPEANPGPTDTNQIFDEFATNLKKVWR